MDKKKRPLNFERCKSLLDQFHAAPVCFTPSDVAEKCREQLRTVRLAGVIVDHDPLAENIGHFNEGNSGITTGRVLYVSVPLQQKSIHPRLVHLSDSRRASGRPLQFKVTQQGPGRNSWDLFLF